MGCSPFFLCALRGTSYPLLYWLMGKRGYYMRRVFKLRSRLQGQKVKTDILSGEEGKPLHIIGVLDQDIEGFTTLGALLQIGSEARGVTRRDTLVILEGEEEIVAELYERHRLTSDPIDDMPDKGGADIGLVLNEAPTGKGVKVVGSGADTGSS